MTRTNLVFMVLTAVLILLVVALLLMSLDPAAEELARQHRAF